MSQPFDDPKNSFGDLPRTEVPPSENRNAGTPPPYISPYPAYGTPPRQANGCWTAVKILLWLIIGGFVLLMLAGMFFGALAQSVGTLAVSSSSLSSRVSEKTISGSALSPNKIVVLPIEGMITEEEDGFVRRAIQTICEDPKVKAIILRINSPGGTISGSDYYYSLLKQVKQQRQIPIIVSMGPMATSGGYYVAMAGDKIYAERSTVTGSIGVICMLFNAAGLCEKIGVGMNNITSGANKGMGDFSKPMSDSERAIWQGVVDDAYRQFLDVVREGRPMFAVTNETAEESASDESTPDDEEKSVQETEAAETSKPIKPLEEIADGRIYTAPEAKRLGLIDEIGFLDEAVNATLSKLNLSVDEVQVVRYKKLEGLAELFSQMEGRGAGGRFNAAVETLSCPTVYFLAPGTVPAQR